MALNDIYAIRVFCRYDQAGANAQNALNVYHFITTAQVGAGASFLEIANQYSSNVHVAYKNLITQEALFWGVTVQKIEPLPVEEQVPTAINRAFGAAVGEPLPTVTCGMITKRDGLAGRRHRGRIYVPFPIEDFNVGDAAPNPAYIGFLGALIIAIQNPFLTVGINGQTSLTPVLYHRGATPRTTTITSYLARPYWTTQRRRSLARRPDPAPFA